jgi:hypothetical protein
MYSVHEELEKKIREELKAIHPFVQLNTLLMEPFNEFKQFIFFLVYLTMLSIAQITQKSNEWMINEFEGIWKEAADSTSTFPWRD